MSFAELQNLPSLREWLAHGERGISSDTIVQYLTGMPWLTVRPDVPYDPSDFRRCELLLRQVPLLRLAFKAEMPSAGPVWAALAEKWDEIVRTSEEEVPGCFSGAEGPAPRAYALIRECHKAVTA